jgi:hypothetical protein
MRLPWQLRTAILNDLIGHSEDASHGLSRDNLVKDQKITFTEQTKTKQKPNRTSLDSSGFYQKK